MSYRLFGATSTLLTYPDSATAFTVTPNFASEGRTPAFEHYTSLLPLLEGMADVAVAVAAEAEAVPLPPAPATLQDLVLAARARLNRERARSERDDRRAALEHIQTLRELVRP
jgi:hypothetical protein